MILVANGCSHTAGAEIEHAGQGECHDKAWPKHLADKLGYEHVNLSMSGASGHRVVRTTLEFLYLHYQKNDKCLKNLFFVILWPGFFRTEIHSERSRNHFYDDGWCPLVVGNDDMYKNSIDKAAYMYYKSWVTSFTRHHNTIDYYQNVLLLQNIFQKYGVKYLFWNASMNTLSKDPMYAPYYIHISEKTFPKIHHSEYCFTELCRKSNQKLTKGTIESGFASHYNEDAHKWFAGRMYDYMTQVLL